MASVMTPFWLLRYSTSSCSAARFTSFHFRSLSGSLKSNSTLHWRSFWISSSSRSAADASTLTHPITRQQQHTHTQYMGGHVN